MPRDYKHRAQRKPAKKPLPGWLWLLTGLLLGAFIMGLVWLRGQSDETAAGWHGAEPDRPPTGAQRSAPEPRVPAKPQPRFDFYDMLRDQKVPDLEQPVEPLREPRPDAATSRYLVQVGSFRKAGDADGLKARLTLMGYRVQVQRADLESRVVRYRVRVGPYTGAQAAEKVRRQLGAKGFSPQLVRVASG